MFVSNNRSDEDEGEPIRYRICPLCGSKQRTIEHADGECHQPVKPIYTNIVNSQKIIDIQRGLFAD